MKAFYSNVSTRRKLKREVKKAIRSARNIPLPMKHYEGDPKKNEPEFEEVSQSEVLLNDFLRKPELWRRNQVKLQVTDMSLWFEFDFLDNATLLLEEFGIKDVPLDCCVNWRISGKTWKFPSHFDCVHQYVVHLYGKKKWLVDGKEFILQAGDVLHIPMGVYHSAENIETSLIMNFQFIPPGMEEKNKELCKKFEKVFPLRVQNIETGKDFPTSLLSQR